MYKDKLDKLFEAHTEAFRLMTAAKDQKLKRRRKRLFKWSGIGAISLMALVLLLFFLIDIQASTYSDAIIASIIANIIGGGIGFLIARYKENPEKIELLSKKAFLKERRESMVEIFSEMFWLDLKESFDEDVNLSSSSEIQNTYFNLVNEWKTKNKSLLEDLHQKFLKYLDSLVEISNVYFQGINDIYDSFGQVLKDTDSNSEIISQITQEIKDASIKPSFEILSETTLSLENVKEKIQLIKS